MSKTRSPKHPFHFQAVNKRCINIAQEWLFGKKKKAEGRNEHLMLSKPTNFFIIPWDEIQKFLKEITENNPGRVGASNQNSHRNIDSCRFERTFQIMESSHCKVCLSWYQLATGLRIWMRFILSYCSHHEVSCSFRPKTCLSFRISCFLAEILPGTCGSRLQCFLNYLCETQRCFLGEAPRCHRGSAVLPGRAIISESPHRLHSSCSSVLGYSSLAMLLVSLSL